MKIFVIGATGMAGTSIVETAINNNIEVVANGKNGKKLNKLKDKYPKISTVKKDAFNLNKLDFGNSNVVVDAAAFSPLMLENKNYHLSLAKYLVKILNDDEKTRLAFIVGAGSLKTGDDNHLVYNDIVAQKDSKNWRIIPYDQLKELEYLETVKNVNWFAISPASTFKEGLRASKMLMGKNSLLINDNGESVTTSGTMANAMINEIINPMHHDERFTVANG